MTEVVVGGTITLVLNALIVAYGAGTVSNRVKTLGDTFRELATSVHTLSTKIDASADHGSRIGALEREIERLREGLHSLRNTMASETIASLRAQIEHLKDPR
ncbi:MAG TPA: hypothetical protein VEA41_18860 [Salinarimonas sp.]|nr:hypothetical protein [Salinarimonas sp.]